ncbi:MAG: DMT family transporter [archaeon]|jgi:drug/metabolite transporter (DMT)-like permease
MAFELVLLAAFAAMVFWGFGDFLIQKAVRKIGDLEALAFLCFVGAICLFPFVLNDLNLLFSLENLLVLLLLGIITFVGAMFTFEAFKKGKISVVEVVIEFELPVTIVLGFVLFSEVLSIWQLLLVAPIFFGILLMAVGSGSKKVSNPFQRIEKGVILGIVAAVGMGLINSFTALSSRQISPIMAVWFPFLVTGIVCFIFLVKQGKLRNSLVNIKKYKLLVLGMAVFDTAAWLFYAVATSSYNIGVITAITESYPVIAIVLGVLINKEKITPHQCVGALIAIGASLLLAMTLM